MIEACDLAYSYPGVTAPALSEINLRVEPGEMLGIVGPNGSGKSTLGRLLKALIFPSSGRIQVDGLDSTADAIEVRRRVGLVFQNPNSQIVNAVVEQEVAFGPENLGLPAVEIRQRVTEALRLVGLSGRETAECHTLSMADKQRVALASVLSLEPRYLILDEPTAWIEPHARWSILSRLAEISREREVAIVLITHRMDEALLCSRLHGMLHGRILATGSPLQVLNDEETRRKLSLMLPESFTLASELRAAGLPAAATGSIEQLAEALCPS
jgi:energy-coupling factor transport system ATP-binding protein